MTTTADFLALVEREIRESLQSVLRLRNQRSMKEDESFVTQGDLLINERIHALAAKAGVVVVSEESPLPNVSVSKSWVAVVDPIDGTENFTSGLPEWGVSVSCYRNGRHEGSLLACPEMNSWMKTGDSVTPFSSRIRGLSSSLSMADLERVTRGHEYRIMGCCVYNMINVIRGSYLSFENPKGANAWDILAGLNIALEHKLNVTVNDEPYAGAYLPADKKYRFRVSR